MQSVTAFQEELKEWTGAIALHAMMCRMRTDEPPGAMRDFVDKTSQMTRAHLRSASFWKAESFCAALLRRADCEALHDLIMEGV